MKTLSRDFAAGESVKWEIAGGELRIISAVGSIDVTLYRDGMPLDEKAFGVDTGFYTRPRGGFHAVEILSSSAQTIKLAVSSLESGYDKAFGSVTLQNPNLVIANTTANPVPVVPASGSFPVTGPLTDAQLRAAAVPVSGPLTDAQLRAAAVPVSGPLTDAQLRAAVVPVLDAIPADVTGWASTTPANANTAQTVFAAAANTNGAIIYDASARSSQGAGLANIAYIAKATAPSTVIDSLVISPLTDAAAYSGFFSSFTRIPRPIRLPAGVGLFYIADVTESQCMKSVLYKLL